MCLLAVTASDSSRNSNPATVGLISSSSASLNSLGPDALELWKGPDQSGDVHTVVETVASIARVLVIDHQHSRDEEITESILAGLQRNLEDQLRRKVKSPLKTFVVSSTSGDRDDDDGGGGDDDDDMFHRMRSISSASSLAVKRVESVEEAFDQLGSEDKFTLASSASAAQPDVDLLADTLYAYLLQERIARDTKKPRDKPAPASTSTSQPTLRSAPPATAPKPLPVLASPQTSQQSTPESIPRRSPPTSASTPTPTSTATSSPSPSPSLSPTPSPSPSSSIRQDRNYDRNRVKITFSKVKQQVSYETTKRLNMLDLRMAELHLSNGNGDSATTTTTTTPLSVFSQTVDRILIDGLHNVTSLTNEVFKHHNNIDDLTRRRKCANLVAEIFSPICFTSRSSLLPRLYNSQLENLRDKCGEFFERKCQDTDSMTEDDVVSLCKQTTKMFEDGCAKLFPSISLKMLNATGDGLVDSRCFALFDSSESYQGLLRDMKAVVELRNGDDDGSSVEEQESDDTNANDGRFRSSRLRKSLKRGVAVVKLKYDKAFAFLPPKYAKWAKKFTTKALKLGVNFFQGSLALRSARMAALKRDKAFPKFPLI